MQVWLLELGISKGGESSCELMSSGTGTNL